MQLLTRRSELQIRRGDDSSERPWHSDKVVEASHGTLPFRGWTPQLNHP